MAHRKKTWRKINVSDETEFKNDQEIRQRVLDQSNLIVVDREGHVARKDRLKGQKNTQNRKLHHALSPAHHKLLEKARKRLNKSPSQPRAVDSVFDLWGDDIIVPQSTSTTTTSDKQPVANSTITRLGSISKSMPTATVSSGYAARSSCRPAPRNHAPAVKYPHPGQSINPDRESHLMLLESEATRILEVERAQTQLLHRERPITTTLLEFLPKETVDEMSLAEKQKVLLEASAATIKPDGVTATSALINCPSFNLEQSTSPNDNVNDDIKNESNDEDHNDADDDDVETYANNKKKMPEKKSKGTRNREKRHAARLEKTRMKRVEKQFLHSVTGVKSIIKEFKKKKMTAKQRLVYWRALRAQWKDDELKGCVRLKIGKTNFTESETAVSLTEDIDRANGSLRRTQIPMCASPVTERMKSVHRRGLTELPVERTVEVIAAAVDRRRKMRKQKKAVHVMMREAVRNAAQRVHKSRGGLLQLPSNIPHA